MKNSLLFVCILSLFCACSKGKQPLERPPSPVETVLTKEKNIPYFIDTLGHFAAFNTVTIQAQVQGELTGLYFEEGQRVSQGDLLFTIDKRPYQAVLNRALATLKENEAILAYNLSRQERYSGLVEEDFVSKLQYQQYVSELESQQALIEANVAEVESAKINVDFCTLFSPITGFTGKRLIDVGNVITDVGTKMLVINQIAPLFIDFSIPERHFEVVQKYQKESELLIQIFVPNTPLVTYAHLQMLDNTMNPETGMIALRGILPNENHLFWPQQFVRIRLIVYNIEDAIMIPPEAIISTTKGEMVWLVDEDFTVAAVPIEIGEEYDGEIRVIHGLKPNQRIVIKGQLPLREGGKVVLKDEEGIRSR